MIEFAQRHGELVGEPPMDLAGALADGDGQRVQDADHHDDHEDEDHESTSVFDNWWCKHFIC